MLFCEFWNKKMGILGAIGYCFSFIVTMDKNWQARSRLSLAVREGLVPLSPSGWQPTGPAWRLLTQGARTQPLRASKRLNDPAEKRSPFKRMPPLTTAVRAPADS